MEITHEDYSRIISTILAQPLHPLSTPVFQFQCSIEAAEHNWAILTKFNLDLGAALSNQQGTPLAFGSEFRSPELLEPLLNYHPLWPRVRQTLIAGVNFPLATLPEAQRTTEVRLALRRGNHQSVKQHIVAVQTLIWKEVAHGWQLPLPRKLISELPGVAVAPLGLVSQATINARGEIVPKHRLTHDQSFEFQAGASVNSRVQFDQLTPCRYGTALRRFIHYIVDLQRRYPTTKILLTKLDFKAAYRRLHLAPATAIQSVVTLDALAFLALRLTFGGAPCPSKWSDISELTCDTCNQLSRCSTWNPWENTLLQSPHQARYVGTPKYLPTGIPYAAAHDTIVSIDSDDFPYTECYIDDLFTCFLDTGLNHGKGSSVALLALHLMGRPLATLEPLMRDDLLSFDKMLAEGTPEETKVILGWQIDTRQLLLQLPADKHQLWTNDIQRLLALPALSYDELATTVGRFNHAAHVVPTARAFLCHLRRAEAHARQRGKAIKLDALQMAELQHWTYFLARARVGLSLNLLTLRTPTIVLRADACEHGVGGYSLSAGIAWRFAIHRQYWGHLTLNLLEYIASAITIAVALHGQQIAPYNCVLSQLDSTTADYWLLRGGSKFQGVERTIHLQVSCWLSTLLLQANICTYSQWIPGEENVVADSLSRDHHLSDKQITHLLQTLARPQLPPNFQLSPLPDELASKITSWLQLGHACEGYKLTPKRSTLALFASGSTSSTLWGSMEPKTPSWTTSIHPNASASSGLSPMPYVQPSSIETETRRWQQQQCEIPSQLYRRPLPKATDPIHSSTFKERLTVFYNSSSRHTSVTTPVSRTNEPSH